jgi:hypothetical protein
MGTNDAASSIATGHDLTFSDGAPTLSLPPWQVALKSAIRDPAELERLLELPPNTLGPAAETTFPMLVRRSLPPPTVTRRTLCASRG